MSLEGLGRQVTGLPTADSGEEGGNVGELERWGLSPSPRSWIFFP